MRILKALIVGCVILFLAISCSNGGQNPAAPDQGLERFTDVGRVQIWGLYELRVDAVSESVEVIPLRSPTIEVNVLKFLEAPGPGVFLKVTGVNINPPQLGLNLGITHPFVGQPKYNGFMVRGVIITDGSLGGFGDPDIVISGPDELRVTNADGHIRWLNPSEFPFDDTIMNYFPGFWGNENGDTYASTLNPYKLYANDLDNVNDDLDLDETKFAMFSAGMTKWRRYEMDFGSQAMGTFQYAILASWAAPLVNPPSGPEDFPPGTVATEPWRVDVIETTNDLYYDNGVQGGSLSLQVTVRDFENADQDEVFIEAQGVFPKQEMNFVSQDGSHMTFELDVAGIDLSSFGDFDMLISAIATDGTGYDGRIPGKELGMYLVYSFHVSDQEPQAPGWPFYDDFENYDYIWTSYGGEWWAEANNYMDAAGGTSCYEDNDGSGDENLNTSYVQSPGIDIPDSESDLIIVINHEIDVDIPEEWGHFAWDMCYVRIDGEQIFPTEGPAYEDNYYPWTFDPMKCWTTQYSWTESTFNVGPDYNGTTIHVEFVLDTYDNIDNCDPPNFGWHIDDVLVDFAE